MNSPDIPATPRRSRRHVVRLLAMPAGTRPLRCLVDFQALGLEHVLNIERQLTTEVFTKMGMERLLTASATSSAVGP
jgi:hypothetical protein